MCEARFKMAASMGRVNLLTRRAKLVKSLVSNKVSRATPSVSASKNTAGLFQSQRWGHSMANEANTVFHATSNVRYQSSSQPKEHVCWNCNHSHSIYVTFCEKCHAVQEPEEGSTHFDIMGIPQSFDIDTGELTKTYRRLQSLLHPDKFTTKSPVRLYTSGFLCTKYIVFAVAVDTCTGSLYHT